MGAVHAHRHGSGDRHGHAHGHAHGHGEGRRAAPLATALGVTLAIAVLECAGGVAARSLALVTDSAHVLMDAVVLGIAVFAARQARRPATDRRSFGYARVEVLAALGSAVLLFGIAVAVAIAAVQRFGSPQAPAGSLMAAVAAIGATANVALGFALARSARGDLNARAALLHVVTDVAGAAAVAAGGVAVALTHAPWIDPALSLAVAALIVAGVVHVVREAADVLLESTPAHLTVPDVRACIRALPGVLDVHDLHVWSIGSGRHVLSTHVRLADGRISEASDLLRDIDRAMRDEFAISHVTVQFECESCGSGVVCTQA